MWKEKGTGCDFEQDALSCWGLPGPKGMKGNVEKEL